MSAVTAPLRPIASRPPSTGASARAVPAVRDRHGVGHVAAALAVLAAAVLGIVAINAMSAALAVDARALERTVAEGERAYGALIAEVAALEDPARIRALAIEQGMEQAGPTRYLVVERAVPGDDAASPATVASADGDAVKSILSMEW